jgi:DNA-binding winged helix-turn-helix (wHTH) protein/TolB-like protein/Tfp pilus assembly protein PilF
MARRNNELYEFNKFRLDVSERILWRDGERVALAEKAFETLCALVRRGNHLVSKEELLNEIWGDTIVEENNLDKSISLLRQVLGERAGAGKFIETVRGHGFRFVAEVQTIGDPGNSQANANAQPEAIPEPPASPAGSANASLQDDQSGRAAGGQNDVKAANIGDPLRSSGDEATAELVGRNTRIGQRKPRRLTAIAVCSLLILGSLVVYFRRENANPSPATQIKSVAVLPFRALLAGNRNEALEMGMTDTLISKLSGGVDLAVRPLSSVRRYTALERDSVSAGRELNTEAVLDGSIQTSGERIRISVRLIHTGDGKQLWTENFDEKFTDIFAVQDAIAERVASALKFRLQRKQKKRYTENVEAYQLYMKGRFHVLKATRSEIETGIDDFRQAIAIDPNYALAYSGLADGYRALAVGGEMPPDDTFPKAKAAADMAIKLDDTLAEAVAVRGHITFWYDWDWSAAENQYKRALDLDPNNADALHLYAHFLSNMGRHAEALPRIKRARELDPLNLRINTLEGLFLLHAGQTDAAIASLRKTLALDPNYRLANMMAARAYVVKGSFAEAIVAAGKANGLAAPITAPIAYGAYAQAKAGNVAEARAALGELFKWSSTRYIPPYHIALIYNGLGEHEKALDYLEKACEQRDVRMVFLKVEPTFNNLRSAPRFVALIKRMQLE